MALGANARLRMRGPNRKRQSDSFTTGISHVHDAAVRLVWVVNRFSGGSTDQDVEAANPLSGQLCDDLPLNNAAARLQF